MSAAKRIGEKLGRAMKSKGVVVDQVARQTDKQVGHVTAVLEGYPNSKHTMLDTVDEIAAELGLKLDLTERRTNE
jgi:hypothetical protein